jgi:deoxyribose-phosphate aldolase
MTAPKKTFDPSATARTALACLDLTSLNDHDTEADIARLCARAQGPHGTVAAVCVWPRLAAFARRQLPAGIGVAAVANFPDGSDDLARALRDTGEIVQSGANEVDVVLPYNRLLQGDDSAVSRLLGAVRQACPGLVLKVILETGELLDHELITRASRLSLDAGADFLKTSTGKTKTSATPLAAQRMLACIAADPQAAGRVGFKPSGGIRTVAEARAYMDLHVTALGLAALTPQRFRIGASSLLNDIEAVLGGSPPAPASPGSY